MSNISKEALVRMIGGVILSTIHDPEDVRQVSLTLRTDASIGPSVSRLLDSCMARTGPAEHKKAAGGDPDATPLADAAYEAVLRRRVSRQELVKLLIKSSNNRLQPDILSAKSIRALLERYIAAATPEQTEAFMREIGAISGGDEYLSGIAASR